MFYKLCLKNTNADAVNENADGELDDDSDGEVRTDDEDKKVVNNLAFCETDFFFKLNCWLFKQAFRRNLNDIKYDIKYKTNYLVVFNHLLSNMFRQYDESHNQAF